MQVEVRGYSSHLPRPIHGNITTSKNSILANSWQIIQFWDPEGHNLSINDLKMVLKESRHAPSLYVYFLGQRYYTGRSQLMHLGDSKIFSENYVYSLAVFNRDRRVF